MSWKEKIIIFSILLLIVGLYGIRLQLLNNLSVQGINYVFIEDKIEAINSQNLLIRDEILQNSSLFYINQEAQKMGFVPQSTDTIIYLIN